MPKNSPRRSPGSTRKSTPRKAAFTFELGERTYPQPILTGATTFDGKGSAKVDLGRLSLVEDHLRGLGWRVVCTIQGEGKFLTSTSTALSVVKNVAYAIETDKDEEEVGPQVPTLTLVGPPKATAVVIAQVTLLYKPQV